jgi:MFS family permease
MRAPLGKSVTGLTRDVYIVTGLSIMINIAGTMISPFFSLYLNAKGASTVELGLIISLMAYTTLLTRIPLGVLTTRIGIWWVVPLSLVGQSSAYILYNVASNVGQLYLIRVFHAITTASTHPTLMSLVSATAPEGRKGEAVGIYLTSAGLATMGGPLLSSLLLQIFDYEKILYLSATMSLTALAVYFLLLKTGSLTGHFAVTTENGNHTEHPWSRLTGIATRRPVQALTYLRFTFAFTMSIVSTIYALYVVNILLIAPAVYALLVTIKGLANALTRVPIGRLSDTTGRKTPLLFSFILLCITFLLFSMGRDVVVIGATMLLYGVAHGTRAVSEWTLLADVVPRRDRSLANFYFSTVFDLGTALGATFAGVAATLMTTPMIMRVALGVVSTSIVVIFFLKEPTGQVHR